MADDTEEDRPSTGGYMDQFAERADCALTIALSIHDIKDAGAQMMMHRMLEALVGQVEPIGVNRRPGASISVIGQQKKDG